ncbi:MAG: glycosyltransferase [Flavobacteriales bacterium]
MLKSKVQPPVLILGMHRSGTTMVAEALNSAGVYAGAICDHNREALYAVDLNERMLEAAGGKWWQPPTNDALEQALANFQPELDSTHLYAAHLKVKSGKTWRQKIHYSGPWLIKDPRFCLTLPWWLERFPNAKVIWVLRDEQAVVSSLLRRQEKSDEAQSELDAAKALELHYSYNAQASATLKAMGVDYRAVRYEDLVSSDEAMQRKSWFSLYQFASVKPGQLLGFKARHITQDSATQTTPKPVLPIDGPLVSVIVPNYNHAAFLDERIGSILNQTYTNIEVLLMDDCSSDNSCEVLQRWAEKDERITTLFNEINSGSPFAQWEKGANWAQGKYIWIAESDDYAAEDMLALHVQALESNHRAVLAYSHSRMADVNGKILRDFKEDYAFIFGDASKWSRDFIVSGKEEVARTMVFSNTIPNASGVLMRKSAFDQVGAPATTWLLNGDWLFYAQLLQLGDLIFFATPRNFFRFHNQTQRSRAMASYEAFDEILAMYQIFEDQQWTTPEILASARGQVAMWWASNVLSMRWTFNILRNNLRLYRTFRRHRTGLSLYLFKSALIKSTAGFIKALGLKKPVKRIATKLFPKTFFPY